VSATQTSFSFCCVNGTQRFATPKTPPTRESEMFKLFDNDKPVPHFPHPLPNGMRALRFDPPSRAWPSGKVILNDGHSNYVAAPPAVGLAVRNA
jgi:hypothetical protein